jgi:hypothetical protein
MCRAAAFLMLLTALAVPASALAQSAGDEQYSDPFGPEQPQEREQAQQEQPQAAVEPAPSDEAPAPAPAPEPAAAPAGDSAAAPAQSSGTSLPVTGLPVLSMFVVGGVLLAAGAVVRRRV